MMSPLSRALGLLAGVAWALAACGCDAVRAATVPLGDCTVLLQTETDLHSPRPAQRETDDASFKYQAEVSPAQLISADASNRQTMVNIGDIEYVSYLKVGGQTIAGILDTGSFELVVFSTECKTCGMAAKYNPKKSSDHKAGPLMTVQSYGSGDTYSWEASDMIGIGPFQPKNQSFWEVVDARMPILRSAAFQAIVGVGPPETPAADAWSEVQKSLDTINRYYNDGKPPPRDVIKDAKDTIDAAMEMSETPPMLSTLGVKSFSICMGAKPGTDGFFTWQDSNHNQKPHLFTKVSVLGKHTWSVGLTNVRLTRPGTFTDIKLGCHDSGGCSALVDSGTSLLAVPSAVIARVQDIVSKMKVDCKDLGSLPNIVFELGGKIFSLPPDAYVAEVEGKVPDHLQSFVRLRKLTNGRKDAEDTCNVLLMESYMDSKQGPVWIFGMPFFRKYYTTFHIGDGHSSRALYVAQANDDCRPAEGASLARTRPHTRRIDVSKVHLPPLMKKKTSGPVDL